MKWGEKWTRSAETEIKKGKEEERKENKKVWENGEKGGIQGITMLLSRSLKFKLCIQDLSGMFWSKQLLGSTF